MGKVDFTEKQLKAIETNNSNILVSAAAGSGKTAVLIEKIKRLVINQGVSVSNMLVVTFTEAAASEMKTKLVKAMNLEIDEIEDESIIKRLKKELDLVDTANISTFHSFALDSIKKFYSLINIEPNLKIIDDAEKEILLEESMDELIENYFEEKNHNFIDFINKYTDGKKLDDFRRMIYFAYNKILSMEDPFLWLDESLKLLKMDAKEFNSRDLLSGIIDTEIKEIEDYLRIYEKYLSEFNETAKNTLELLNNDIVKAGNFIEVLKEKDFEIIRNYEISWDTFSAKYYKGTEYDEDELKKIVKDLRDGLKKSISDFKKKYFYDSLDNLISDINYTYESSEFLVESIKKFHKIFSKKKEKKGLMTFSDIEHFSYEILKHEEAKSYYRDKFKYIFIDEFQDTNGIQYAIIDKIKSDRNLFMVGDVKQSIYRFREADPDLFIKKYNEYEEKENKYKEDSDSIKIDLNGNFRSKKKIVNFVNYVFEKAMDGYDDNEKLIGSSKVLNEEPQDVKSFVINSKTNEDDSLIDNTIKDFAQTEREALATSYIIKNYVYKMGFKNSDIAILLRKNRGDVFYNILNQNGIDSYIDDNDGYFDTIEINTFCSLLNVIDNEEKDVDLLTIMRSEMFNFTVSELSLIRLNGLSEVSYHKAILKYMESGTDDKLKEKCKNFVEKLSYYRNRSYLLPLDDFVWEVLIDSNFYISCGALPSGKRRQANLIALVDKARSYRVNYDGGLYNFTRYIERVKNNQVKVGQVKLISEGDNVVKIMTIHKSKGLQFPVVIMPSISSKLMYRSGDSNLFLHKDIGFSLKHSNYEEHYKKSTILENIIKDRNKHDDVNEEKRILYVALTRAESVLYLISSVKDKSEYDSLCDKIPSDSSYLKMTGKYMIEHLTDREYIDDSELSNLNKTKGREKELILKKLNEPSGNISSEVDRRLRFKYDSQDVKSKYSVSELNRDEMFTQVSVDVPKDISHEYSASEIGTIMHKVLYEMDFHLASSEGNKYIEELLDYMEKEEMILEDERKYVSKDNLLALTNSEIGNRIRNSKNVVREKSFTLKNNSLGSERLIQGVIDLFFYEEDGIVLIDYKTTKKKDEDELRNTYMTQIDIYREAIEKSTGLNVKEAYLYLTNSAKLIKM